MTDSTDSPIRRRRLPFGSAHAVAVLALIVSLGGTATAAALITGQQIKNGTVTGKDLKNNSVTTTDVRNGSLRLKDFKASERRKLRGAPGASAYAPPPSGTTISGAEMINAQVSAAGVLLRNFVELPFTPAEPLLEYQFGGANLFFGTPNPGATGVPAAGINTTACPGSAASPAPAPGMLCVYVKQSVEGVATDSALLVGGFNAAQDEADLAGFIARVTSSAAGEVSFRFVWAYRAP